MAIPQITIDNVWKLYYYIALFATTVFILKLLIFTFAGGGDSEVSTDFNTETDSDLSFNFISVQSVLSFLMGFGWMGYAGLKQFSFAQIQNLIFAILVGLVFLFVTAFLMYLTKKLEKKVVKDKTTAINKIGKAYTKFSPHSNGKVEVEINEQLTVTGAINDTDEEINSFDAVKVTKVINDVLYIEKFKS